MVFLIPVVYSMYGRVDVEAKSVEDAIEWATNNIDDLPLPYDADYLLDSFEIDTEGIILDEHGNMVNPDTYWRME